MSKDTGGAAFPQQMVNFGSGDENPDVYGMGGMTLRDYFAIHCDVSGILERITVGECRELLGKENYTYPGYKNDLEAVLRYRFADAMLQERLK